MTIREQKANLKGKQALDKVGMLVHSSQRHLADGLARNR